MTVVQADGNNVSPVRVDEFRIAVAETYDVIVQPTEDRAYTIVGEPMDRTGFARPPWHRGPAWSENCRRIGYGLSCRCPTWP
jgi:FtsP/CotA-like multicopper oxidase with cupredoxin domain